MHFGEVVIAKIVLKENIQFRGSEGENHGLMAPTVLLSVLDPDKMVKNEVTTSTLCHEERHYKKNRGDDEVIHRRQADSDMKTWRL